MAHIETRTNSKGQIISYRIKVSRGYDADGKRLMPYQKTWIPEPGMTKRQMEKEANRQAMLFEEECNAGNAVIKQSITFKEFIPKYLEITKVSMSPLILQFYERIIDRQLIPYFGNKKMQDISSHQAQCVDI